jgi:hypothetical protein
VDILHFTDASLTPATVGTGTAGSLYIEGTATDYASATTLADTRFGQGFHVVAVQVGGDVVVFADTSNATTNAANLDAGDDAVVLVGRSLTDIDYTNIG